MVGTGDRLVTGNITIFRTRSPSFLGRAINRDFWEGHEDQMEMGLSGDDHYITDGQFFATI